jgi:beta-glucosidase
LGADNVTYAKGFDAELAEADAALIDEAVAAAKAANVAIIMAGLPPLFEAEGFDRTHLRQPEQIEKLISAVADANENCVVVLSNGAPIEMPWLDAVPAVLEIYLAGQAGAHALVDLVLGDVSPSGKLAESFPMALADCPAQENFATHKRQLVYREGLNIGYRYFTSMMCQCFFRSAMG